MYIYTSCEVQAFQYVHRHLNLYLCKNKKQKPMKGGNVKPYNHLSLFHV